MFQLSFIAPSLASATIDVSCMIEITKVCMRLMIAWVAYFILFLFHTDLAVLPSIFSSQVLQNHSFTDVEVEVLLIWMLVFVTLPLLLLIVIIDATSQPKERTSTMELKDIRLIYFANYYVSVIYTILNIILTFVELFAAVNLSQFFLCILLLLLGVKINYESYKLLQIINNVDI